MDETLGKRIVSNRKRLGITQDRLAEQLGVTAQAVSKWENDQSCPDIAMLPKLAEIFGITTDELLGISQPRQETVHKAEIVDADADDRLIRVAQRDIVERGRTIEAVMERYQRVLKPMHEQFIETCKRYADVIIPQGGHNNAAINMLVKFIKQELKEKAHNQ